MGLTSRGNSAKVFLRHPFRIKGKNRLYPIVKKKIIFWLLRANHKQIKINDDKNKKFSIEEAWKN